VIAVLNDCQSCYCKYLQKYWQTCKRRSQIPLNWTLTIALTLLTLKAVTLTVLLSTVQEFGTAVYRIAKILIGVDAKGELPLAVSVPLILSFWVLKNMRLYLPPNYISVIVCYGSDDIQK